MHSRQHSVGLGLFSALTASSLGGSLGSGIVFLSLDELITALGGLMEE